MFGGALEPLIGEGAARNEKGSAVTKWITNTHRHTDTATDTHTHTHTGPCAALQISTSKWSQIAPTSNLKAGGNVRLAEFGSPRMAEVIWRRVWAGWASVSGICASAGQVLTNIRLAGSHCEQTYHHSNQHHIATSVQQRLPMEGANFRCGEPVTRLA